MDKIGSLSKDSMNKGKDAVNKGKDAFFKGISKFKTANPRDQSKFQFDIQILKVDSLATGTGPVYVAWKRGSKSSNNGQTKSCSVSGKTANINHSFSIITTLQKEKPPKKTYEDKNISVSIKEEKGKKASTLGKTILNLAEFTSNGSQFKLIQIKVKKGSSMTLSLNINTKELEMDPDGEPMTETDLNSNDGSDDEEGEDFQDDDLHPSDVSSNSSYNSQPTTSKFTKTNEVKHTEVKHTTIDYSAATAGITDEKHKSELNSLLGNTPTRDTHSTTSSPMSHGTFNKTPSSSSPSNVNIGSATAGITDERHKSELSSLLGGGGGKTTPSSSHINSTPSSSHINSTPDYESPSSATSMAEKRLKKENDDQKKRIQDLEKQASQKGGSSGGSLSKQDIMNSSEYIELKNRFKEVASENVDMEDKIKELETRLNNTKSGSSPSFASTNVTSLPKDLKAIADLQENLKQRNNTIGDLNTKIKSLENDLYQQLQHSSGGSDDSSEKDREIESLKREIQNLKDLQNTNVSMVGGGTLELKRKIQDLTKEVKDKDETIKQLRSGGSSSSAVASPTANSTQIKQLENQIQDLNKTNSSQKLEIDKLKQEISMKRSVSPTNTNSNEANDLKTKIQQLEADVRELSAELEERSEQFTYRENQLNSKISDLKDENEQLQNKMSVSLASASSLSFANKNSNNNNNNSSKQEFKAEKEKFEKQIETLNNELQKERDRTKKLQRELTEQNNRVRDLENQLLGSANGSMSPSGGSVAKTELQERDENRIIEQCIYTQSFTYYDGIGATASSLYQKLTDQNTFSQENSRLFNKVICGLTQSVEKAMYNSSELTYWLSNTSGLIHIIKDGPNNINDSTDRDPIIDGVLVDQNTSSPTSTSRRSPSLNFYYQLESLSRECYSLLLHNIYKKLQPKLTSILHAQSCILDKKTNRISSTMTHTQDIQKICKVLSKYLNYLKDNFVFDSIIQQFFSQVFHYLSFTLLNQIIEGSGSNNFCSPSSGFKVKLSISMIEDWISTCEDRELLLPTKEHFNVITEAANLMVIDKSIFTDSEAILSAFITLNILQIKKLLEIWKPDQLSPDPIPSSVITMAKGNWNRPTNNLSLLIDPTILINVVPLL